MFSPVEITLTVFAVSNSLRVLAYVPQILRVARDRNGATAVSCLTWLMFAVSHLSTVAYALVVVEDGPMAAIFGVNMLCCLLIIALTCYKRALAAGGARPVARQVRRRLQALLDACIRRGSLASALYSKGPSRR